jgi:Insertion element 4 transposase N-terminal
VVVYYTLAMCLFAQVGYEEVMDFPPRAGHRGYAARVEGSGWS